MHTTSITTLRLSTALLLLWSTLKPTNAFSTLTQNAYTDWVTSNGGNYDVSALFPPGDATDVNLAVHWSINIDDETPTIHLAVAAEATGWLGFGIAEAGGMPGSDIAVFTTEGGVGTLTDAYATTYSTPKTDDQQDWILKSYSLDGGFIIWEGERLLQTCDNQDWEIRDDSLGAVYTPPHKIIAAWGSNSSSMSYHGDQRVSGEIRFFGNGEETASFIAAMDAEAEGSILLTAPGYTVPSQKTTYTYFCFSKDDLVAQGLPADDGSAHIIGIEAVLNNSNSITNVHHIIVETSEDANGACSNNNADDFMYVWAFGQSNFQAPANTGFRYGPDGNGAFQSISMEVHYDNPESKSNIIDNSGFRFYYTTKLRQHDIGIFELADPRVSLIGNKVGSGVTQHTITCPGSCSDVNFNQDVTVFLQGLHMHNTGERMETKHKRNGVILHEASVDYFDFNKAGVYVPQQPSFTLQQGDAFETTCYYNTEKTTTFGLGSENEMCIQYLFYYPRQAAAATAGGYSTCGLAAERNDCRGDYSTITLDGLEDMGRAFGTTRQSISDPSCSTTLSPTSNPVPFPSSFPTSAPTDVPSESRSNGPSTQPSIFPTAEPTARPSAEPTARPSVSPTYTPTASPVTSAPTSSPSKGPSKVPTKVPTKNPTASPTRSPTNQPIASPSIGPTPSPIVTASAGPSVSRMPTVLPSAVPIASPTYSPTMGPTSKHSMGPTDQPSASPSAGPTNTPSVSQMPTVNPSVNPTATPIDFPIASLSASPSSAPTAGPSISSSGRPSTNPSVSPTIESSVSPSGEASLASTGEPTARPSEGPNVAAPGNNPTKEPTKNPSGLPTTTIVVVTGEPTDAPIVVPAMPVTTNAPVVTNGPTVTTTVAPVSTAPAVTTTTSAPVALTLPTYTEFNMTFDGLNCNEPLTAQQKNALANITANFLADDDEVMLDIESLDVVNVSVCDAAAVVARQFQGYGLMEFTMALQGLIAPAGASLLFDVKQHIEARFNDTDAVEMFLMEIRSTEALTSMFELVSSLDVEVLENEVIDTMSSSPSFSPSRLPAVTITTAPVVEEVTGVPVVSTTFPTKSPVVVDANDATSAVISVNGCAMLRIARVMMICTAWAVLAL